LLSRFDPALGSVILFNQGDLIIHDDDVVQFNTLIHLEIKANGLTREEYHIRLAVVG
jgi:hypothetical protein